MCRAADHGLYSRNIGQVATVLFLDRKHPALPPSPCGSSRHIQPEALARLVGWATTFKALAPRLRCSQCGKKAAEVVAVAKPRPRGIPKNPH